MLGGGMDKYAILKDFAAPAVALIGVIVTGSFAFAGLKTFERWKREKLEEKRIDIAIEVLSIGFEAQIVFDEIRSRFVAASEYADMKIDGVPSKNDQRSQQQHGPYAVLKRVEARQSFFNKVVALEPKFVALFGREKETIFQRVFAARREIIGTAEALIDDYRIEIDPDNTEGRAQRVAWRKQIFASPGTLDSDDNVGKLLQEFREEIEKLCRPVVDRSFKRG
jgi:hypothetical protein